MPGIKASVSINTTALQFLIKAAPERAKAVVKKIAFDMVRDIQQSFTPGHSEPGEPPGVDTGALKNSIHAYQVGEFSWAVSDGVEYGYWLEYGTEHMGARPFFEPAAERARQRLPEALRGVASVSSDMGGGDGGESAESD